MKHPKVTIGVILFKGEKYLLKSISTLVSQDYPHTEYLLRDQSPNGEAYEFIKKNLPEVLDKVKFEQGENLMHSGGHNVLMRKMTGEYYLCASYDMLYPSNLVSTMVQVLEKAENKKYGSATCKLMRWDFKEEPQKEDSPIENGAEKHKVKTHLDLESGKTNFLDSAGITLTQSNHFYEIGQGEEDKGQYDHLKDIFGASGALTMFRKKALEDIVYTNKKGLQEYYDELLHYKNDVDLAYRLEWAGWLSLFIPEVKVYHDRQVASKGDNLSLTVNILRSRNDKSNWAKESSFLGHLIVLQKNFNGQPFSLLVRLKTAWMNFLRMAYVNIFERYLLKQLKIIKTNQAEIKDKAEKMPRKVKPAVIEKLMMG